MNMRNCRNAGFILATWFTLSLTLCGCSVKTTEPETQSESRGQSGSPDKFQNEVQSGGAQEESEGETKSGHETEVLTETDLESYFQGIRGGAVFYEPGLHSYTYYNPELWEYESSPCSTFKIISALMGLEHGVIDLENSLRTWDGEAYWNQDWNRDTTLLEAFRSSCIWYFREVIDELGPETVQTDLDRLEYGNRDISDWAGVLNTNNNSMRLRGFWVESSLKISPRQQVEALGRIFGGDLFSRQATAQVKAVMLTDSGSETLKIYGKTGMGVRSGRCVDAWFVGFYEDGADAEPVYFAVRLDDPENPESSSKKAREIAVDIITDR